MLKQLVLNNIPKSSRFDVDQMLESVPEDCFYMQTCQRTLILSYEDNPLSTYQTDDIFNDLISLEGEDAYSYLLEVICGLKSKLIGENEIVGQFKTSYKQYIQKDFDSRLLQILEKLFKDAKDIRSNYLIGLSQKTYASIARKKLVSEMGAKKVVILGSGQLAEDLINQFKKKIDVIICARNSEKVNELAKAHDLKVIPWQSRHLVKEYPFIVNTIGTKETLIAEDFFKHQDEKFEKHLFIDLGSPSAVSTQRDMTQGFMSLDDVFKEGAIKEERKRQQVTMAKQALEVIVEKRSILFTQKMNVIKEKRAYV